MTILVAVATGGVGKRVVQKLLTRDYQIRALVRDAERGKAILGKQVELFEADLTLAETLKPEMMAGVNAVICCAGTKVQPVEGDKLLYAEQGDNLREQVNRDAIAEGVAEPIAKRRRSLIAF